jgi:hypothetical protein
MGVFNKIFLKFAAVLLGQGLRVDRLYGKLGLPDLFRRPCKAGSLIFTGRVACAFGIHFAFYVYKHSTGISAGFAPTEVDLPQRYPWL